MSKRTIRGMAMLLCALLSLGTVFTGCGKTCNTYAMSDIAYIDEWADTSETNGEVRTYNMQNVYATETLTVTEVYVEEGQQVKKGDKLLAYDTTLSDIEVDKKKLEVMEAELAVQNAEKNLATVNSYKPMVITTITPDAPSTPGETVTGSKLLSGSGTQDDPYIYVVENGEIPCGGSFVSAVCPAGTEKAWAVFQTRSGNSTIGKITDYCGICYKNGVSGTTMTFFEASEFCKEEPTEPYEDIEFNSGFTAAEISAMRADAKAAIEEANYKYRLLDIEYQQMLLEVDGGVITAEMDGTIEALNDKETSLETGEPMLKLSANGGYIVEGSLSELELDTVSVGQKVTVTSWEFYQQFDAEITSISTIPTNQYGWTNGNTNVSYYPFTVYIDGSANLKEYEWVSIAYSSSGGDNDYIYLQPAFILSEGSRSYVFLQNEDGVLEKREIKTGEMLWGSYVKVLGGVTADDRIAFPYDKNAKDGVKAVEATIDELYNYY